MILSTHVYSIFLCKNCPFIGRIDLHVLQGISAGMSGSKAMIQVAAKWREFLPELVRVSTFSFCVSCALGTFRHGFGPFFATRGTFDKGELCNVPPILMAVPSSASEPQRKQGTRFLPGSFSQNLEVSYMCNICLVHMRFCVTSRSRK